MEQPRLLLIDANSLVNRAFYGLYGRQNLTAPDGTPTGALFAFLNMYLRFKADIQPTHVLAAFDRKESTFRHDLYPRYKGTRKPMPDDLACQLPMLHQLLDAMQIAQLDLEGYEADDLIGTYAETARKQGYDVVILTGDKDSFQLIGDHVTVMQPVTRAGKTETERYDTEAVIARYGITPAQFVDLKAIMGDPSDNIPGVKGIGEKGAMSLIFTYGSLDGIYAALDEIKKPLAEKLAASREIAYLSRELSQICLQAPVSTDIAQFASREPDADNQRKLYELMNHLGFRTLIARLGLKEGTGDIEPQPVQTLAEELPMWTVKQFSAYLATLILPETVIKQGQQAQLGMEDLQIDADAYLRPRPDQLIAMELEMDAGALIALPDGRVVCVPEALSAFLVLTDFNGFTAFFDLKQQLRCLQLKVLDFDTGYQSRYHDVMISGYLLSDMDGRPDWPRLYERLTGQAYPAQDGTGVTSLPSETSVPKSIDGKRKSTPNPIQLELLSDPEMLLQEDTASQADDDQTADFAPEKIEIKRQRLAQRVQLIHQVAQIQIRKTVERKIERLTWQIEMPLTPVLAAMETTGFAIDASVLSELNQQFAIRLDALQEQIFALSGRPFNLNSPKQLGDILFIDLGLKSGRKILNGAFSTDAGELDRLMDQHVIIPLILEHRQLAKLRSTFLDGLSRSIDPRDQRVHTTLNQANTATGRLSSIEPNLQNIPIRMSAGQQIRRAFVAKEGHILLDADYSQIELRLLAHLSGDHDMINAFVSGQDIHINTAMNLFQLPADQITKDMRSAAKTVNFSIVYGISDFGLARNLGITLKEAHRYILEYNEHYPGVRTYLESLVAGAYEHGYVETMLGRRRYIHELKSPNRNLRNFGERVAMNSPVQGTAADLIKLAMVMAEREMRKNKMTSQLILQVHDELIVEAKFSEADAAAVILKEAMESAMTLRVPLLADVHRADNWYKCKQLQ